MPAVKHRFQRCSLPLLVPLALQPTRRAWDAWSLLFRGLLLRAEDESDCLCYLLFTINYALSCALIDMFPAASAFLFGLLASPRPSKTMMILILLLLLLGFRIV